MFCYISVYFCLFICVLGQQGWQYEGDRCISKVDGFTGTCVSWRRCLSVVKDIKQKIQPQLCSYQRSDPIVCCTDCNLVNDTRNVLLSKYGTNYFKTGSMAADKCLEYSITLDYNCTRRGGVNRELDYDKQNCYTYASPSTIFVVGGEDAKKDQYPHMALLGYGDDMDSAQWLCGGSVISEKFILTAAHCVATKQGPVRFVGLGILKRSDPPETWQRYTVKRSIPHPEYKAPSKYHDIALLETTTKIKFSSQVLPACLTTGDENTDEAVATGWGAVGHRKEVADNLQYVALQQFSKEDCANAFPVDDNRNLLKGYQHDTQTCYGDKEKIIDTCPGDSGGPLQVTNPDAKCMFNIIGVTSFGTACGFLGSSGIYTRVAFYKSWIEYIVWPGPSLLYLGPEHDIVIKVQ